MHQRRKHQFNQRGAVKCSSHKTSTTMIFVNNQVYISCYNPSKGEVIDTVEIDNVKYYNMAQAFRDEVKELSIYKEDNTIFVKVGDAELNMDVLGVIGLLLHKRVDSIKREYGTMIFKMV